MTKKRILAAIVIASIVENKLGSVSKESDVEKFNDTAKQGYDEYIHKLNKRHYYKSYKHYRHHRYI